MEDTMQATTLFFVYCQQYIIQVGLKLELTFRLRLIFILELKLEL